VELVIVKEEILSSDLDHIARFRGYQATKN